MEINFEKFKDIAIILAHQDDEVPISWLIKSLYNRGCRIKVYLMTTGASKENQHLIQSRNLEMIRAFQNIGISSDNLYFLGEELGVSDGSLHRYLTSAYSKLREIVSEFGPDLIMTLCKEGGHQDHDSCNLLSRHLCLDMKTPLLSFSLYNGFGTIGKFFKSNKPIFENGDIYFCKISIKEILFLIRHTFFYPSQIYTWIGLLPLLLISLFRLKIYFQKDDECLTSRPHKGPLLYERYNRITYDELSIFYSDLPKQSVR